MSGVEVIAPGDGCSWEEFAGEIPNVKTTAKVTVDSDGVRVTRRCPCRLARAC